MNVEKRLRRIRSPKPLSVLVNRLREKGLEIRSLILSLKAQIQELFLVAENIGLFLQWSDPLFHKNPIILPKALLNFRAPSDPIS